MHCRQGTRHPVGQFPFRSGLPLDVRFQTQHFANNNFKMSISLPELHATCCAQSDTTPSTTRSQINANAFQTLLPRKHAWRQQLAKLVLTPFGMHIPKSALASRMMTANLYVSLQLHASSAHIQFGILLRRRAPARRIRSLTKLILYV